MSDEEPKLIAIDEEANDQIVHRCRFGKAHGATYEPFHPGRQIEVFALDFLCMLLANVMLLWGDMLLVGAPSVGGEAGDAKRLQQRLQLQKHRIFPSPTDRGSHGATLVIDGMP
jgi:hypothetical protein